MLSRWKSRAKRPFLRRNGSSEQTRQDVVNAKLPYEIWVQILEQLDVDGRIWEPRTALAYVSRTCRYLHAIAEPLLYSVIRIVFNEPEWKSSVSCIPLLETKPHLRTAVRRLLIYGGSQVSLSSPSPTAGSIPDNVYRLYNILPHMTYLRQVICIFIPLLPSLHHTIFSHPTLRNVVFLCPLTVMSPLPQASRGLQSSDPILLGIVGPFPLALERFAADTAPGVRALLSSGAAPRIRYLTVKITHAHDYIAPAIPYLFSECNNVVSLSMTGSDYSCSIKSEWMPRLTAFSGSPRDACAIVPGRPVSELELKPNNTGDVVNHDLHFVPQALRVISPSSTPLRSLSITLHNPLGDILLSLPRLFPQLSKLQILYRNTENSYLERFQPLMETVVYDLVSSLENLSEFDLHCCSVEYRCHEWASWEPTAVQELGKRCPSLLSIRLKPRHKWIASGGEFHKFDVPRAREDENTVIMSVYLPRRT